MSDESEWINFVLKGPGIRIYVRDGNAGNKIQCYHVQERMFAWCQDNCVGRFWIGSGFGEFQLEQDAVLFKLRWS
jgi:hypothetical protein